MALQALVSEPIKPLLDCVVMANTVHGYISQSDKGEMVIGGGADGFNNYTQRGSFHHIEETVRALIETFPVLSRLKMLRQWGGIVDMTGDRSPIIGPSPVPGIFLNCGWGTGGFKAIPGSGWATAEMLAKGAPGDLAGPFGLEPLRGGPDDRRERRRGGGALMAGLHDDPIEEVDPELFEFALMTAVSSPARRGKDVPLGVAVAEAYVEWAGIDAEPGVDALSEAEILTIVAVTKRILALGELRTSGLVDMDMNDDEERMIFIEAACDGACLRDGQEPAFQLLDFMAVLARVRASW